MVVTSLNSSETIDFVLLVAILLLAMVGNLKLELVVTCFLVPRNDVDYEQ